MGRRACTANPNCCGVGCVIFADNFNRADETPIDATNWDERVGSHSVTSNEATTTSANSLLICKTAHPDAIASHFVAAKIKIGVATNQARLVVAYTDDNNYLYAQFESASSGCGKMSLWKNVGGVHTQLGVDVPISGIGAGVWTQAYACYDSGGGAGEGWLRATSAGRRYGAQIDVTGTKVGIGTGANGGTIYFDDFDYERHLRAPYNCPQCDDCGLGLDLFDDTTVDTCLWEQVSGTWSEADGDNILTQDSNAILRLRQPQSRQEPYWVVSAAVSESFSAFPSATELMLFCDYVDSANYHYGLIQCLGPQAQGTAYLLSLWKRTAAANVLLRGPFQVFSEPGSTFTLCQADDTVVLQSLSPAHPNSNAIVASTTAHGGDYCGLGTGYVDNFSPAVGFRSAIAWRHRSEDDPVCPRCSITECGSCIDLAPLKLKVTVAGIVNGTCPDCGDFNGIYIVPFLSANNGDCTYFKAFLSVACGTDMVLEIVWQSTASQMIVRMRAATCFWTAVERDTRYSGFPVGFDCLTFDRTLPIPGQFFSFSCGTSICDVSNATIRIEAF